MDRVKPEIDKLFRAKELRRAKLAALPIDQKVQAVIQMQRMAAPVLRARGKKVRVWQVESTQEER